MDQGAGHLAACHRAAELPPADALGAEAAGAGRARRIALFAEALAASRD